MFFCCYSDKKIRSHVIQDIRFRWIFNFNDQHSRGFISIIHSKLQEQELPLKNIFLLVIDCNYVKNKVLSAVEGEA